MSPTNIKEYPSKLIPNSVTVAQCHLLGVTPGDVKVGGSKTHFPFSYFVISDVLSLLVLSKGST